MEEKRKSEFYLVVTPGLEPLALEELKAKWDLLRLLDAKSFSEKPDCKVDFGGVFLVSTLLEAWVLNHYLKIPTRILMRMKEFKAKDFPKLYNLTQKCQWKDFLRNDKVEIRVSVTGSRLKMKERIKDTVERAIRDYAKHQPLRKKFLEVPQTLALRVVDDDVTLSLDTSGEPLYKRGYKPFSVQAPIRETLASAAFWAARSEIKQDPVQVLDPMCGSGTFLLESAGFWKSVRSRSFAYQNFPVTPVEVDFDIRQDLKPDLRIRGVGIDRNADAVESARKNTLKFSAWYEGEFEIVEEDFDCFKSPLENRPLMILTNPPYNERISADTEEILTSYYRFLEKMRPEVFAIVWPTKQPLENQGPVKWIKKIPTQSGGLPVTIGVGKIKA